MAYTALPDMRMPYDNDGTVVALGSTYNGITVYPSGTQVQGMNGSVYGNAGDHGATATVNADCCAWFWFPEQREVTAHYSWLNYLVSGTPQGSPSAVQGSNDSGNGLDGTWETASLGGACTRNTDYDWRSTIKSVSFTGGKRTVREYYSGGTIMRPYLIHWYGEKVAGQTPDDIIYINHDDTPGVEFTAAEDFSDRPLGTTETRQFRLKNTSATKTANSINVQCNDSDFAISTDNSTWVVTINITSLSAGSESATLYVRNTTPGAGNLLGPRFARIITTVGSWT